MFKFQSLEFSEPESLVEACSDDTDASDGCVSPQSSYSEGDAEAWVAEPSENEINSSSQFIAFDGLLHAATISKLEEAMMVTYNAYIITVCLFLFLVKRFLPVTLCCGHKLDSISQYVDYMKEQRFAPLRNVSTEWAIRYASGGEVYMDLLDKNISYSDLPNNFSQLRHLTPVLRKERHVIWSEVLRKTKGRPTAIVTSEVASGATVHRKRYRDLPSPTNVAGGTILDDTSLVTPARPFRAASTGDPVLEGPMVDTYRVTPARPRLDVRNQDRTTSSVVFSCTSVRYGTPAYIVQPSRETLGGTIDLDPFSEVGFDAVVGATKIYTEAQDGLRLLNAWMGRVFMNPPGGTKNGQSMSGLAIARAIAEYHAGTVTACVAIVKAAVGYVWFKQVWQFPLCFLHERPAFRAFDAESDEDSRAPTGYVVVYMGKEVNKFYGAFKDLGQFVMPAPDFENISRATPGT